MRERTRNGVPLATILFSLATILLTGCTVTQQPITLLPSGSGTPDGSLLVVFTFGKGCPGDGAGNGLRGVADTIRVQYPGQQVITRGCDDEDGIEQTLQNHRGPIAMVGHSFGGCRSLEMAARLRRPVDWLILLDPVPYNDWAFRHAGLYFQLPTNIAKAVCYYRPAWLFPISYPILNPLTPSDNRLRSWGHNAFCADPEVRQCILSLCAEEQGRTPMQVSAAGG